MRDKILDSMRRSDCVLGVTPDHGGMWLSSLRNDGNSPWPSPVPADSVTDGMAESERVGLLTKTNVRTDRGVFEAADTSKRWSVTTQLRAASLLPECTIIVEVDNPNGERTTFVSCAQRLNPTQGFFVIRKQDVGELLFGYSGKNSSGAMVYPSRYIRYPDGKHIFVFVLDYSVLQLRIYIDGAEVDNRAMNTGLVAPPEFDGTEKPVILGVTSTSDGLNLTSKISHCLIFDRALTASEIAALS